MKTLSQGRRARRRTEEPAPRFCQPVRLVAAGRPLFLLRLDGCAGPDTYATHGAALAVAEGADAMLRLASSMGLRVRKQRAATVNLDAMDAALAQLERSPLLTPTEAKAVLDGWHALEDLARTAGCEVTPASDARLRGAYDRLFYANTFPELCFGQAKGFPALRGDEAFRLRTALRNTWRQVSERLDLLPAPPPQLLQAANTGSLLHVA